MIAGSNTFCVHACSRHKPIPAFGEIEVIFVIVTSRVTIRSWIIIYSPVLHALRFITWKKAKERKSTLKTWQWQRCKIKEWETEERVSVIFLVPLSEFSKGGKGGGGGGVLHGSDFLFQVACFRELSRVLKSRSEVYTEYSIKWIWEISS